MSDKKNIDRLFQEKFKNFEATPNDAVWNKVNQTLHSGKGQKAPIPIWWKIAGIAAVLVVLLTAGNFLIKDNESEPLQPMVDYEVPSSKDEIFDNNEVVRDDQDVLVENNNPEANQNPNVDTLKENDASISVEYNESGPENEIVSSTSGDTPLKAKNKKASDKLNARVTENVEIQNKQMESNKIQNSNSPDNATSNIAESDKDSGKDKKLNRALAEMKNDSNSSNIIGKEVDNSKRPDKVANGYAITDQNSDSTKIKKQEIQPYPLRTKSNLQSEGVAIKTGDEIETVNSKIKAEKAKTNTELPTNVTAKAEEIIDKISKSLIDEAIAKADDVNEEERDEEIKIDRWNISPNISPVYFNSLNSGSSIDSQFNENSKTGDVNFSYGINGSYAINEKLKVRTGINKLELGYSTNDVIVYRGISSSDNSTQRLSNIKLKEPEQNTSFLSATNLNLAIIPDVIADNIKGSIDQKIGFIEIPVEVEYSLLNKRVGLNLIGGFSTFFLNKNEVYSTLQGDRRLIGEATNLNSTSYSANLGLGFNFNFTKSIDLSLEPTFKYQLNTFNNSSGNFQPYIIGVYSGLRIKF